MYNTDMPTRAELPTSRQLLRSTGIAIVTAGVLLVTVVLPSEYGIDPTGVGGALGLTEMGEIKSQLADEAEADRLRDLQNAPATAPNPDRRSGTIGSVFASLLIRPAAAHGPGAMHGHDASTVQNASAARSDEMSVTLKPGEGTEVKLEMTKGSEATYSWRASSGVVNFDLHGDGPGNAVSYEKGRGVKGDEGVLKAAFDGNHGWFWRNRTKADVTVTLQVQGEYSGLKRMD